MKKIFFCIILLLNMGVMYSQREKSENKQIGKSIKSFDIIGVWINHWKTPKKENGILYQKDSISMQHWGEKLFFEKDGKFIDWHIVPCKVGAGVAHKYEGKWKLENNIIKIYNLKEIYNSAHYYSIYPDTSDMKLNETGEIKILKLNKNEMIIEFTKNYEEKMEQKVKKQ